LCIAACISPPHHLRYRGGVERGDLTGAILDGRYRVLEPIAEGAMGVVYRAERVKLGRIVAIKVLHDVLPNELSARKRFEIEAMAMAKLEHPHCASVLDVGVHDDRPYVVMDFVSGQNLKDVVDSGPQPIARAAEIVRQVLSGLAHAHELGIVHRDIKPANIVLSQKAGLGDHVKILDFGLARVHHTGQNLTTGLAVGTPAYMAPEQVRGGEVDARVDLYACGILLFELVTGHKPFHSVKDDPIEVCRMHLAAPIPRLADRRPGDYGALDGVVATALAKNADDRFVSAQAFAAALDAVVPHRPSVPAISTPIPVIASSGDDAMQLASGDVMAMSDASLFASGPVVIEDSRPRTAITVPETHKARTPARTATPPAGAPQVEAGDTPLRTFLGIAVTPHSMAAVAAPTTRPSPLSTVPPDAASVMIAPSGALPVPAEIPPGASGDIPGASSAPAAHHAAPPRLPPRWVLIVAGGVIVAGTIAIAVTSLGGSATPAPPDAAITVVAPPVTGAADPIRGTLDRVDDLVKQDNRDAAIDVLYRARRQFPANAQLAYTAGRLYFAKLFWSDGLKSFRDAIRADPGLRTDPELIKTVLRGFLVTPSVNDEIASFLRDDIGPAARPFLEEAAHDHPNPDIRRRAAAELRRYH
jgi:serine/threonine protein kinase